MPGESPCDVAALKACLDRHQGDAASASTWSRPLPGPAPSRRGSSPARRPAHPRVAAEGPCMASFRAAPGRTSPEEFGRDACSTLEVALASVSRPFDGPAHVNLQELTGRVAAHADGLKMAIAKMAVLWNTAQPLCPADTRALLQALQDRVLGICAAFCSLTCAGHTLQVSVHIRTWD